MRAGKTKQDWVQYFQDGIYFAENLGGVSWHDAPIPRRWHRCGAQSRALFSSGYVERCACGAIRANRFLGSCWLERNTRRRENRFACPVEAHVRSYISELCYRDSWGDLIRVTLVHRFCVYRLTQRFGETESVQTFWRWGPAVDAYDRAVDNAIQIVEAIENGIPTPQTWPPDD